MSDAISIDIDQLVRPITDERPGGEDMAFSGLYDQIKDARTGDDPGLAAGVWTRELKTPDWPRVRRLAVEALAERSKDLQVACWLTEALLHLDGFAGARDGLVLLAAILRQHWEHLYPENDGDLEPRANCLAWLSGVLGRQVRARALTTEGRGWYDYQAALQVDNERDRTLKAGLIAEGKIDGETWRKQIAATPTEEFAQAHLELIACQAAAKDLGAAIDETFGREGPGLRDLHTAIQDVLALVGTIARERGIAPPEPQQIAIEAPPVDDPLLIAPEVGQVQGSTPSDFRSGDIGPAGGPPRSREDAIRQLQEIADFFRRSEPHSPVAYLLERAAKWANMPLDLWLQEVVKDPGVLSTLNETLGVEHPE
jgi:type VI secretion system protein ImpA